MIRSVSTWAQYLDVNFATPTSKKTDLFSFDYRKKKLISFMRI